MEINLSSHGMVALVRNGEGAFLLLEDCREPMRGYWAPPHGRLEASDASEETGVVRETREETGLEVVPVRKLLTQAADTKVRTVSFWLVDVVGGALRIDPSETGRYGWFTLEEALDLQLYPGTKVFLDKISTGEVSLDSMTTLA